jgi:hypothetical protein
MNEIAVRHANIIPYILDGIPSIHNNTAGIVKNTGYKIVL